jgi:hypothetical protein
MRVQGIFDDVANSPISALRVISQPLRRTATYASRHEIRAPGSWSLYEVIDSDAFLRSIIFYLAFG